MTGDTTIRDQAVQARDGEKLPAEGFHPEWPEMDTQSVHRLPRKWPHLFMLAATLAGIVFLVWASVGTLDVVSLTDGEVIPSTKVKRVEHLEGGIVREILVEEGDEVVAGQPLAILEETAQGAEVGELEIRLASLAMDIARLQAESRSDAELVLPEEEARLYPELAEQVMDLFQKRRTARASEISQHEEKILQLGQDVERIKARLRNNRSTLAILNQELAISADLLKDNLTTEMQHLQLKREASALRGLVEEDEASLVRAESSLAQGREQLEDVANRFQEQVSEELNTAKRERAKLEKRMERSADSLTRTEITAVTHGVVQSISVRNPGEVVSPGETLMLIVPSEDALVVEARLPIRDIGYVAVGQETIIKLASRDAGRFGEIRGRVESISPDTTTLEDGRNVYTVRVVTETSSFERNGNRYDLYPGMIVLVYIRTGERTVLEYLVTPFLDSLSMALTER